MGGYPGTYNIGIPTLLQVYSLVYFTTLLTYSSLYSYQYVLMCCYLYTKSGFLLILYLAFLGTLYTYSLKLKVYKVSLFHTFHAREILLLSHQKGAKGYLA
jgi:hypothetical protein